jgi:hypothetical protein
LPVARAVITEILTAHFFVTHPHYLDTMLKLRKIQLRICSENVPHPHGVPAVGAIVT